MIPGQPRRYRTNSELKRDVKKEVKRRRKSGEEYFERVWQDPRYEGTGLLVQLRIYLRNFFVFGGAPSLEESTQLTKELINDGKIRAETNRQYFDTFNLSSFKLVDLWDRSKFKGKASSQDIFQTHGVLQNTWFSTYLEKYGIISRVGSYTYTAWHEQLKTTWVRQRLREQEAKNSEE
eukprot:TRINITY_DN3171_c0_g2_i1.p1 TRINITY_DN3171_c0_g2~~TRINITY_DN3171_c0_g2_i1.p1  ORF type:complete len:178 (+),score=26.91 TRINITY_DN3171_c0_g2_i1:62-595(+)